MNQRVWELVVGVYALVLALIVVLADRGELGPVLAVVHAIPAGDKVAHALLLGALAFAVEAVCQRRRPRRLPLGGIAVAALVLLEECSQSWFPTRNFELRDLAADAIGISLGIALAMVAARRGRLKASVPT